MHHLLLRQLALIIVGRNILRRMPSMSLRMHIGLDGSWRNTLRPTNQ